jgi:pimeloyl-ACP methyl ester carboxylesterase
MDDRGLRGIMSLVNRRTFIAGVAAAAGAAAARSSAVAGQPTRANRPPRGDIGSHKRVDEIDWYYELTGNGPVVVLIPSGEGDCGSFQKVATSLAAEFTVLTFDMPGFSRTSDPADFEHYTMSRAAGEIAALVKSLGLGPATVYGCSSGGHIALCLGAEHTAMVRQLIVHEAAGFPRIAVPGVTAPDVMSTLPSLPNAEIVRICKERFRNELNEIPGPWDALGEAFHQRLERDYVTWARRYLVPGRWRTFTSADLHQRPLTWTVGALTPAQRAVTNVIAARDARLDIGLLPCRHFPQVTIPQVLAEHIGAVARRG